MSDYRPSEQVDHLIQMVIDYRYEGQHCWENPEDRRFRDGNRHGLRLALRALVELETKITDPDDLDELCADLIDDTIHNRL